MPGGRELSGRIRPKWDEDKFMFPGTRRGRSWRSSEHAGFCPSGRVGLRFAGAPGSCWGPRPREAGQSDSPVSVARTTAAEPRGAGNSRGRRATSMRRSARGSTAKREGRERPMGRPPNWPRDAGRGSLFLTGHRVAAFSPRRAIARMKRGRKSMLIRENPTPAIRHAFVEYSPRPKKGIAF